MNWENDFERQLAAYSEIQTLPREVVEQTLPRTIRQYQQRINSNNTTSIFDTDFSLNPISKNEETKIIDDDLGVFKDERVTYFTSGRGRGGRNIFKPGDKPNTNKPLDVDEEIRQQIRKVIPMGYGNEITESAVRAHKMARGMEHDSSANVSPTITKSTSPAILKSNSLTMSKASSPAVSKSNSPAISKSGSEANIISPAKSKTNSNQDIDSPVLSGKSTPCTTASDVQSSEYFTSQERDLSSSSSKSNDQNDEEAEESSDDEHSEASIASTGAAVTKVVPLSLMLKQSREALKKKQLERRVAFNSNIEDELASQRKIQEILRQDRLEEDLRMKELSGTSSSSSLSSRDEVLPWRRRGNSPPRYSWGQTDRRKEPRKLNINSTDDFPALK